MHNPKHVCVCAGYVDAMDLISQLMTERLPLFHRKQKVGGASSTHLPAPHPHTPSSSPSSPLSLTPRLTNQIAAEGMLSYLLDCFDRASHEERISAKVRRALCVYVLAVLLIESLFTASCNPHSPQKVSAIDRKAVLSAVRQSCVAFTALLLTDWLDPADVDLPT